jgi:membrane-bound acyltransferase YfiQ involved in biofilm formation
MMAARGSALVAWLAAKTQKPAALLWFVLPAALIQASLRARYPEHQNWSDFFVWLVYFVYGFLFLSDQRFMETLERHRWIALGVGLVSFIAMIALLLLGGYAGPWELNPVFSPSYALYQLLRSLNTWAWVVFFLGIGTRRFNFYHPLLKYSAEAILPFYILHHVAVIVIAYALLPWRPPLLKKFLALSTISMLVTLGVYEFLVRRSNPLRILFGMRPKALPVLTGLCGGGVDGVENP